MSAQYTYYCNHNITSICIRLLAFLAALAAVSAVDIPWKRWLGEQLKSSFNKYDSEKQQLYEKSVEAQDYRVSKSLLRILKEDSFHGYQRIGSECHLDETTATKIGDSNQQPDIQDDDHVDGKTTTSVEVRSSGEVSIVDQELRWTGNEPRIGTIFQVVSQKAKTAIDDLRESNKEETAGQVPACITEKDENSKYEINMYELVEPLHVELGLTVSHKVDFVYKPVASQPNMFAHRSKHAHSNYDYETERFPRNGKNHYQSFNKPQPGLVLNTRQSSYKDWLWNWFSYFGSFGPWSFSNGHKEEEYERMGERAFAAGSHGEVWRARRRCYPSDKTEEASSPCDDAQELVMKRLKLEHGINLLEAGLREVYFGKLLQEDLGRGENDEMFFTKYEDHFFRNIPLDSSSKTYASNSNNNDLELWIVFENGGPSLRSYLYTAVQSGGFMVYHHSSFWRRLRMSLINLSKTEGGLIPRYDMRDDKVGAETRTSTSAHAQSSHTIKSMRTETRKGEVAEGKLLMQTVLKQILTSAAFLHENGIVHRDIKPSNIMCSLGTEKAIGSLYPTSPSSVHCVLGDFSSAWDDFSARHLYADGPSPGEQTDEYAPPEVLFGVTWIPFQKEKPQSYDSWSIGVMALELLLGTPNVFSVDQRTTALLSNKMRKKGASKKEIQRALYLAALSQFCIYTPYSDGETGWPMRAGEPLHEVSITRPSCTIQDFHNALRARDPLGIGFDSSSDSLLHLIWGLLAWSPMKRMTPAEALHHPYFDAPSAKSQLIPLQQNELQHLAIDPEEFVCPKCGRVFSDLNSCSHHATARRHAKFCTYDRSVLPPCLNAHSMLPAHPTSGYCDIQGRRSTIEDFHTVHLHHNHQFYGVFDGHLGNLASKYAASTFYERIEHLFSDVDNEVKKNTDWKENLESELTFAFEQLHLDFLEAVDACPGGVMDQSGTTATIMCVTQAALIIANIGDSRAVLSSGASYDPFAPDPTAVQLTVDHVASNETEKRYVEEVGGSISSSGGISRVNGVLAVTRSIGDRQLAPYLSRVPHVVALTIEEVKDQCGFSNDELSLPCFIILASDGLWDVMGNQEAVEMVEYVMRKYDPSGDISWEEGGAFQEAALVLTQEAYVRGSTDNIGVCVVAIT